MLEIKRLSKTFKVSGRTIEAVKAFDLTVASGEVVALLGSNGAGKTTTIKMLCGLVTPTTGSIGYAGISLSERKRYLGQIGVVLEGARSLYWRLTAFENVDSFCRMHGLARSEFLPKLNHYFDVLGLDRHRDTECRFLSRGNQQKVAIACVLSLNAPLLLLDEPTLGLDIQVSRQMMEVVAAEKDRNRTLIVTTHDMEFIERTADSVLVFADGAVKTTSNVADLVHQFGNGDGRLSTAYLNLMKGGEK